MDKTTNEKLMELLIEQTYSERIRIAKWLADSIHDHYLDSTELPDPYVVAVWLQEMAEGYEE